MTNKYLIGNDDGSEHMLVAVSRMFDHLHRQDEEMGEVINDGLRTGIKMIRQAREVMSAHPGCVGSVDGELLYNLILASEAALDAHTAINIAQAEGDRKKQEKPKAQDAVAAFVSESGWN